MSETPRLSRRELRELGKLQARPADSESTTDTTELHLRRPSRKEMRELEKAQTGTFAAIKVDADDVKPVNEAPEETVAVPLQNDVLSAMSGVGEEAEPSAPKQVPAVVATPVDEETQTGEPAEEAEVEAGDVAVVDEEKPKRTSVFHRFKSRHDDKAAEDTTSAEVSEEPAEVSEEPAAVVVDAPAADEESVSASSDDESADDENASDRMRSRLLEMTKRHGVSDASPETPAAVNRTSVIDPAAKEEEFELAPSAATAAIGTVDEPVAQSAPVEDVDEDDEVPSGRRTFLNYLLLLIIASLIGLLIGLWINATFLADRGSMSNAEAVFSVLRI